MSLQILLVDDEPAIKIGFRQLTDWSKTPYTLCGTCLLYTSDAADE